MTTPKVSVTSFLPPIVPKNRDEQFNVERLSEDNLHSRVRDKCQELLALVAEFKAIPRDNTWMGRYTSLIDCITTTVPVMVDNLPVIVMDATPLTEVLQKQGTDCVEILLKLESHLASFRRVFTKTVEQGAQPTADFQSDASKNSKSLAHIFNEVTSSQQKVQATIDALYRSKLVAVNKPLPDPKVREDIAIRLSKTTAPSSTREQLENCSSAEKATLKEYNSISIAWNRLSMTSMRAMINTTLLNLISPIAGNLGDALAKSKGFIEAVDVFKPSFATSIAKELKYEPKCDNAQSEIFKDEDSRLRAQRAELDQMRDTLSHIETHEGVISSLYPAAKHAMAAMQQLIKMVSDMTEKATSEIASLADDRVLTSEDKEQQSEAVEEFEALRMQHEVLLREITKEFSDTWETLALNTVMAKKVFKHLIEAKSVALDISDLHLRGARLHEALRIGVRKSEGGKFSHREKFASKTGELTRFHQDVVEVCGLHDDKTQKEGKVDCIKAGIARTTTMLRQFFEAVPAVQAHQRRNLLEVDVFLFDEDSANEDFHAAIDKAHRELESLLLSTSAALATPVQNLSKINTAILSEEARITTALDHYKPKSGEPDKDKPNFRDHYGTETGYRLTLSASAVAAAVRSFGEGAAAMLPSLAGRDVEVKANPT